MQPERPPRLHERILDIPVLPRYKILKLALYEAENKRYFDKVAKKYKEYIDILQSGNNWISPYTTINLDLNDRKLPRRLVYNPSTDYREVVHLLMEETERSDDSFREGYLPEVPAIFRYLNLADKAAWGGKFWLKMKSLDDLLNKKSIDNPLKVGELMFSGEFTPGYPVGENLKTRIRPPLERVNPALGEPAFDHAGREAWYSTGDYDEHYNVYLDSWFTWVPQKLLYTNFSARGMRIFVYGDGRIYLVRSIMNSPFTGTTRDLYNILIPILIHHMIDDIPDIIMVSKDANNILEVVIWIHP